MKSSKREIITAVLAISLCLVAIVPLAKVVRQVGETTEAVRRIEIHLPDPGQGAAGAAPLCRPGLPGEERIQTFYCDMTQPSVIAAMWREPALARDMDIIVDDGLHVFEAQVTLFESSVHKLAKGGD
jgi:hypothetical protein